jgi:hypothetical protein
VAKITVTEALAELKTIDKRIEKKREFVNSYLVRQEMMKDPLEKDGGSVSAIQRERQSMSDLLERKVTIRRAIQAANAANSIKVGNTTRTIADWLVWKRDVAPFLSQSLVEIRHKVEATRVDAQKKGVAVFSGVAVVNDGAKPADLIVNVNEQELADEIEQLEETLGTLDGQLSLKNATVKIDV